ncbi:hypothetical protein [Nocardia rhamnosiphila]|uniref:hypothetical protein n=1 Tax=Nocardia rhamnosiphila TaxID=426716 RepID=UPI000B2499FA|nr:hypothetical protein [Nocardia rhamnosiphila]
MDGRERAVPEPAGPAARDAGERNGHASPMVVGVVADPDLPVRLARELVQNLPAELARRGDPSRWQLEVLDDPFEAMYPDLEYLIDKAGRHVRDTAWDLALCLTDVPIRSDGEILVMSLDLRHRVALVSLPALGGLGIRQRLQKVAAVIVAALSAPDRRAAGRVVAEATVHVRRSRVRIDAEDSGVRVVCGRAAGYPALLAGMVRANRPWRLFVGLSAALGSALAGTAFGVLYSSIWQLANAMGTLRLTGVALASVIALTVWIVVGHGLWERRGPGKPAHGHDTALHNAGTAVTVGIGAGVFFVVLFLLTLAAVCLVIPPSYLASVLGGPVGFADYLMIAVMASALGTVAGAVGSGWEDDITVRKATYGYREQERRGLVARGDRPGRF